MKIYLPAIALAALALCVEAIDEPKKKCQNFISVNQAPQKASRGKRSPWGWGDSDGSGDSDGDSSGDGDDGGDATTQEVTTGSDTTKVETTTEEETTTSAQTTEKVTDAPTTTEQETTGTKGTETTVTVEDTTESLTEKAMLIVLDETGSMQNLGGGRNGRKIVIKKFGQFTSNLMGVSESFADRPVTLVTFNTKAKWNSYSSINNFPKLTKKMYNPGYQTNLYDTLGCVISKYRSENPTQSVDFFVISDGVHKMKKKERHLVEYKPADINGMVDELRQDNWNFQFYGATNTKAKEALKNEALELGFRKAELKVFDFNEKKFGALLKSMFNKATENEKKEEAAPLPDCKVEYPCPTGKTSKAKICRKGRKAAKDQGKCQ